MEAHEQKKFRSRTSVILTVLTLSGSLFAEEKRSPWRNVLPWPRHHPPSKRPGAALAGQQAKLGQVRVSNARGNLSASGSRNSGSDGSYTTSFSVSKLLSARRTPWRGKARACRWMPRRNRSGKPCFPFAPASRTPTTGLLAMRKRDQAESAVKTYQRHLDEGPGVLRCRSQGPVRRHQGRSGPTTPGSTWSSPSRPPARAALSRAVGVPLDHARPVSDFPCPEGHPR